MACSRPLRQQERVGVFEGAWRGCWGGGWSTMPHPRTCCAQSGSLSMPTVHPSGSALPNWFWDGYAREKDDCNVDGEEYGKFHISINNRYSCTRGKGEHSIYGTKFVEGERERERGRENEKAIIKNASLPYFWSLIDFFPYLSFSSIFLSPPPPPPRPSSPFYPSLASCGTYYLWGGLCSSVKMYGSCPHMAHYQGKWLLARCSWWTTIQRVYSKVIVCNIYLGVTTSVSTTRRSPLSRLSSH